MNSNIGVAALSDSRNEVSTCGRAQAKRHTGDSTTNHLELREAMGVTQLAAIPVRNWSPNAAATDVSDNRRM